MASEKKRMNRRTFLQTTGLSTVSSVLALSAGLTGSALAGEAAKADASSKNEMPTRILGKTGAPVSILSLGGIDFTTNQILLRMALKMGVTHWDTAHNYNNGNSEIGIGKYFEKTPEDRKRVFLVTKASGKSDPEGMTQRLNLSFERMKTDYIDLYFMHHVKNPKYLTREIKEWADQKKKEGKIKFFGFSTHSNMAKMLMHASKLGWIDAIMTTYNYHVMIKDDMKAAVDACARADIGLIAMKTQGSPLKLINSSKELVVTESFMDKGYTIEQAKLKTVWQDERIASCCSKMKNITMLKDNVAAAGDRKKLTVSDINQLKWLSKNTCNLYCQGCMRCETVLGSQYRIPDVLRYLMYFNSYGETDEARRLLRQIPESVKKNIAVTDFSIAERVCPHHIEIGKMMREAVNVLA